MITKRRLYPEVGGRRIPTTTIVVQTLSKDWLVEIEIIAVT
jgi:enamine deaminase RidA (YjgF/YER057c/UK114 family)